MQVEHALSAIQIFRGGEEAKNIFENLIEKLSLTKHKDDVNYKFYSNNDICLEWLSSNDTIILHILAEKQDKRFADTWTGYKSFLEQIIKYQKSSEFLGASIIYWGFLEKGIDKNKEIEIIENELGLKAKESTKLKYGILWLIKDYEYESRTIEYAFLSLKSNLMKREFILKVMRMLRMIELFAHIQRDQIRHYKNHRDELFELMDKLDKNAINMLTAFDISSKHRQENLDKLSKEYSGFVGMVSSVNKILNTLQINLLNYKEFSAKIPKEEDEIFEKQLKDFEKEMEQIKYDLNYCDSTIKNVNTGLELLRGADSARMQKQRLIQQAALTVIEVVFVFYYSIGVWHLVVEKSVWERIDPFGKLLFGFILAIVVPLFAHYFMEKKWNYSIICFVFILIAIAIACWLTITTVSH